jgi:hypothetical protein
MRLTVRRASRVEFDDSIPPWVVRAWKPRSCIRRFGPWLTGRPFGKIIYPANTREEALPWEQDYFGLGGSGWQG